MKIIVCIGAVLSIISVCVICLLIKFNNNTSDNDKSEENGRLSDMKLSFEDGCAFLHTDYRLDNPNYVPPEDKSRRKDDENEGAVSTLSEEEPHPFFHIDYRLDKPRKSERMKDTDKSLYDKTMKFNMKAKTILTVFLIIVTLTTINFIYLDYKNILNSKSDDSPETGTLNSNYICYQENGTTKTGELVSYNFVNDKSIEFVIKDSKNIKKYYYMDASNVILISQKIENNKSIIKYLIFIVIMLIFIISGILFSCLYKDGTSKLLDAITHVGIILFVTAVDVKCLLDLIEYVINISEIDIEMTPIPLVVIISILSGIIVFITTLGAGKLGIKEADEKSKNYK